MSTSFTAIEYNMIRGYYKQCTVCIHACTCIICLCTYCDYAVTRRKPYILNC